MSDGTCIPLLTAATDDMNTKNTNHRIVGFGLTHQFVDRVSERGVVPTDLASNGDVYYIMIGACSMPTSHTL